MRCCQATERGFKIFGDVSDCFAVRFRVFCAVFCIEFMFYLGAISFCRWAARIEILGGPAAIPSKSCDTCSDSIAKLLRTCFKRVSYKYRAICCKMEYHIDVPV